MKAKQEVINAIKQQGMLPLFYHTDAELSLEVLRTLYKAGIRVFEYTNRGDAAIENFKFIKAASKAEMPDLIIGIGTIKNVAELRNFIAIDADFIVSPIVDVEVGKITHEAGMLWIPGCMTPTEINLAQQNNAGIIKLFPANLLGPSYLLAIRDLFKSQLFIPTGGVEIEEGNISSWFNAGVCAVGMGSKMITNEILKNKDYHQLFELTTKALKIIKEVKS